MKKKEIVSTLIKGLIGGGIALLVAYFKGCMDGCPSTSTTQQTAANKVSDSASGNVVQNKDVDIHGNQENAGRDIVKPDNRQYKTEVNEYNGLKQRKINVDLMKLMIDNIPSTKTGIEINCGGEAEGEILCNEMKEYFQKRGYDKVQIIQNIGGMGGYDSTTFKLDKDGVFRIDVYPQKNVQSHK